MWTLRSKGNQWPSSSGPCTSSTPPGGSATYGLRVARSVTGSQRSGSTRPLPPGSVGPKTSRQSAAVSYQPPR